MPRLYRRAAREHKLAVHVAQTAVAAAYGKGATGLEPATSESPLIHTGAALALLLVAMILAVYKPRGMTAYGQRKQRERAATR
jgi:hypothetical protein